MISVMPPPYAAFTMPRQVDSISSELAALRGPGLAELLTRRGLHVHALWVAPSAGDKASHAMSPLPARAIYD